MINPVPPDWFVPAAYGPEPVSPEVRQLLFDLSLICQAAEVHGLDVEVATLDHLFRLLASPDGRTPANFRAVREWIDRSGEMGENSDHAPDWLIDLYEEMGYLGCSEDCGPEKLLGRLRRGEGGEGGSGGGVS